MRGKVVRVLDEYWIEYLTESSESDAVEKKHIKLTRADRMKVNTGQEVEFEVISFETVENVELAKIK